MARERKNREVTEDRFTLDLEPDPALGFGVVDDDDDEDDALHDLYLESVETVATIDAIEPEGDDDEPDGDRYRISMHASVSEAAAQQLFAAFVRKGKVRIALLPVEDDDGRFTVEA